MANETPLISVQDLVVRLDGRLILDHLCLDVRRGEILGLVGASGGGKSVLLRVMLGLLPYQGGTLHLALANGRDAPSLGVLFQQGALFSSLTVCQNVEFPMREHLDLPPALRRDIALAKLGLVGISPADATKYPAQLSGGMIKRVSLARALALDPDIVFLDEPTSGLDPISAAEFDALIKTLQTTLGLSVFMVTHDVVSLASICTRVAALAEGKIVAEGPLETLRHATHPWVARYFASRQPDMPAIANPRPEETARG